MEEELKEIVNKMNKFTEKYNCRIEIEDYTYQILGNTKSRRIYKAKAIRPEQIIAES